MSLTADVIVIGGGVIGSSITYFLSKRGKRVIQLERNYFNSGASGSWRHHGRSQHQGAQ